MPTETRRIVFSHPELRQALDAYMAEQGRPLPPGDFVSAALHDNGHEVRVGIRNETADDVDEARIDGPNVAAALLKYCFRNNIPIPKNAEKSLAMMDDNVALDIRKDS
jgi:hypothetical protein